MTSLQCRVLIVMEGGLRVRCRGIIGRWYEITLSGRSISKRAQKQGITTMNFVLGFALCAAVVNNTNSMNSYVCNDDGTIAHMKSEDCYRDILTQEQIDAVSDYSCTGLRENTACWCDDKCFADDVDKCCKYTPMAAIVGLIVVVALICLLALLCYCCWARCCRNRASTAYAVPRPTYLYPGSINPAYQRQIPLMPPQQ